MWTVIIIALIFFGYLFFKDRDEKLNKIAANGGLQNKYSEFFDFFINKHGFKFQKITKGEIIINVDEPKIKMQVQLVQAFNNVGVHWYSSNTAGIVKMNWQFPENMNQTEMTEKIMMDVFQKQSENIQNNIKNINL